MRLLKLSKPEQKFVIFARFISEINAISYICQKLELKSAVLHGKISITERRKTRQLFLSDPLLKILVCQIRTGGVGINELVAASTAVFYSTTYSWIDFDQAISRLHRKGQYKAVKIIHLLAKNTIDEDIFKVLKNKGSLADLVLNTKKRRRMGWQDSLNV